MPIDLKFDEQFGPIVIGVDEAGRGPLAGPVVAAAVFIPEDIKPKRWISQIDDSKQTSSEQREKIAALLFDHAIVGVAASTVTEIDRINILQASLLAMQRALRKVPVQANRILIDGNQIPPFVFPAEAIVKGDEKSLSIAAASIIAKVVRDRLMVKLAERYPNYGWNHNMGYPTAFHREAVVKWGITYHHRKSFLRKVLNQDAA